MNITIGIPAYNEESGIKQLLQILLDQKMGEFFIEEIIVVDDCSDDNTILNASSLNSNIIKVLPNKQRLGQSLSQKKIIEEAKGDLILLLNADIRIEDLQFVEKMALPFANKEVQLTSTKCIPEVPINFLERTLNESLNAKDRVFDKFKKGNNVYHCYGKARMFSKTFAKSIEWDGVVNEDVYSYLVCISKGGTFTFVNTTCCYFLLPETFSDHVKQSNRYKYIKREMNNYFPQKFVERELQLPKPLLYRSFLQFLLQQPILFISYLLILIGSYVVNFFKPQTNPVWEVAFSTKKYAK